MAKIAINGFGRIGRIFFRQAFDMPDLDIVAINDLGDAESLAYMLKYDSVYGRYIKSVQTKAGALIVGGKEIPLSQEKDATKLPWKQHAVDIVVESTGFFTASDKAEQHIQAGAKRVVVSAPATGLVTTALVGVNDPLFKNPHPVSANASCTTNSVAPVMAMLSDHFGVKTASMITVHGYTATQKLVDSSDPKDPRRGRAAAANIVPSTTGAAEAVIQSLPHLGGKFFATAVRVPVIAGSLSIMTITLEQKTTKEALLDMFRKEIADPRWSRSVSLTDDALVSTDIIGQPYGAIVDLTLTTMLTEDTAQVYSWYDNEYGYTATLVEHVKRIAGNL